MQKRRLTARKIVEKAKEEHQLELMIITSLQLPLTTFDDTYTKARSLPGCSVAKDVYGLRLHVECPGTVSATITWSDLEDAAPERITVNLLDGDYFSG